MIELQHNLRNSFRESKAHGGIAGDGCAVVRASLAVLDSASEKFP
jgi:hypothetical protein